jgi:nitrous oxidase accessory protein
MKLSFALVIIVLQVSLEASSQAATFQVTLGQSIQATIDTANQGDIIEVHSGTYHENLEVRKTLVLQGIGDPTIYAAGGGSAITLFSDGNIIEGLVLTGSSASHAGINVTDVSRDNLINGNTVIGNRGDGIDLWASENNSISGNTIKNNDKNGIGLWSCDHILITKNSISNNNGSGLFGGCGNSSITSNTIKANNGSGVVFLNAFNNRIASNPARGNKANGIMLIYGSNNIMAGNIAGGNGNSGISLLFSWRNSIIANTADENFVGIILGNSSENNIVASNAIESNRLGIQLISSNNNTLYENYLKENDHSAFDDGKNQWDNGIRGNHYSDFNCADINKNDICNSSLNIPGGLSRDRYPLAS